jgi:hypothetical protein
MAEIVTRRDYEFDRQREWEIMQEHQRLAEKRHEAGMKELNATMAKIMTAVNRVDERVDRLEEKMDLRFHELDTRLSRLENHFTWAFRIGCGVVVLPTVYQVVVRFVL